MNKSAETMKRRYGEDYFARIGSKGGKNSPESGRFVKDYGFAQEMGKKGARIRHGK